MRNSFEEWCETTDISIDEIERRANFKVQQGKEVHLVFLSLDLYAELSKSLAPITRVSGPTFGASPSSIVNIVLSAGQCHITKVNKLRNFCLVGTKDEYDQFIFNGVDPVFWNDQEKARIFKEFEDIILGDDYET
jgi:hypothetical protein